MRWPPCPETPGVLSLVLHFTRRRPSVLLPSWEHVLDFCCDKEWPLLYWGLSCFPECSTRLCNRSAPAQDPSVAYAILGQSWEFAVFFLPTFISSLVLSLLLHSIKYSWKMTLLNKFHMHLNLFSIVVQFFSEIAKISLYICNCWQFFFPLIPMLFPSLVGM